MSDSNTYSTRIELAVRAQRTTPPAGQLEFHSFALAHLPEVGTTSEVPESTQNPQKTLARFGAIIHGARAAQETAIRPPVRNGLK